jgi:hypothetical protein
LAYSFGCRSLAGRGDLRYGNPTGSYGAPCPPFSRRGRRPPRTFPIDDRGREDGPRFGRRARSSRSPDHKP